jgi:hypothetical protein
MDAGKGPVGSKRSELKEAVVALQVPAHVVYQQILQLGFQVRVQEQLFLQTPQTDQQAVLYPEIRVFVVEHPLKILQGKVEEFLQQLRPSFLVRLVVAQLL